MTHFHKKILIGTAVLSALSATCAGANDTLIIENFIGTITVETSGEDRLRITEAQNDKSIKVSSRSGFMTIDGKIDAPNGKGCKGHYGRYNVTWFSKKEKTGQFGGYKNLEDYPILTISAPEDVNLVIKNAIPFITLGDIGRLDVDLKSCGKVKAGALSGNARISIKGQSDISLGDIQDLDLRVKGSGDMEAGRAGHVKLDLTGSGDIELSDIKSADIRSTGSGDIELENLRGPLNYLSRGSGDFKANDVTGDLVYEGRGSGGFSIDRVTGNVSLQSSGSGRVDIDDGSVQNLIITAAGSGNIRYDGTANTAELYSSGSGDIVIERVTGEVSKRETGSGNITISHR